MAVKIRLSRHGSKKRPYYRVVVADERMPRDGRYIEEVGTYNPLTHPHTLKLNLEAIDAWIGKGAQMSDTVSHLVDIARDGYKPPAEKKPKKSKKQIEKEKEAADVALKAQEEAEQAATQEAEEAVADANADTNTDAQNAEDEKASDAQDAPATEDASADDASQDA